MKILVSTMITTYNHVEYIEQAIKSAIAQKGDYVHEILLADDASTDGTREIVRDYAMRYPELIRDISSETNCGISMNMRKCFTSAKGKYIAVLEGDDFWTDPFKLEKQVRFLEDNPACSMVFSRIRMLTDGEETLLPRHDNLPKKIGYDTLIGSEDMNPICNFSCCLFRSNYMQMLPDVAYEYRLSEVTVAFYLCLFGPIGYMKEPMSDYRIHKSGVFAGCDKRQKMIQALHTFETVRKVADFGAWPVLTEYIENIKRNVYVASAKESPTFSIVTVTFNNLKGLCDTAESIVAQTCRDFEWIVMDGGSSDGSREFLESLTPKPDYWVSQRDGGIYDAMNRGIDKARGAYVICMNAGDVFRETSTLQKVRDSMPTADVVYGDWVRKYKAREEFCRAPKNMPPFFFFMPRCNICHQAMFVRTRLLQESKFDTRYYVAADWAKWREFMLEGKSFQYIPVTVCTFEACEGFSSRQSYRNVLDGIRLQSSLPVGVIMQGAMLRKTLDSQGSLPQNFYCQRKASQLIHNVHKGVRCFMEHGAAYTWHKLCVKLQVHQGRRAMQKNISTTSGTC